MSCFLDLPTELACEIVGKWLCLKDLVRLDSAFCHNEARNVLHESIFQSPLCIVAIENPRFLLPPAIFKWASLKCIRLSTLHVRKGAGFDICKDYLERFGDTVHSVSFERCLGDYASRLPLVARYCTHLRMLSTFNCDLNLCVDILMSCARLRSIDITSIYYSNDLMHWKSPATHHLQIASIKLDCSSRDEETILGMCDPVCVQRLRLANMTHTHWHTFANLRSFGFQYDPLIHDTSLLVQICTLSPWIVNLAVFCPGWLSDGMVVPALQVLQQLRTFHCENQVQLTDRVLYTLIEHHKHTLKAVYLHGCDSVSPSAKSRLLKECVTLHTISCEVQNDIDYSLMSNLTTLIINFPSEEGWNGVQQHCHSLKCLHLLTPRYVFAADSHIIVTPGMLQALRTVYTVRPYVRELRLQLPFVCVVEEAIGEWYDLFELPIELLTMV